MAREKFVVRLLDRGAQMLAWAEVYAEPRPQDRGASCPYWPVTPTNFVIEQDGLASELTVHWCDLDVARRTPLMEAAQVQAGQVFSFAWLEPVWLVSGQHGVPLQAVTIRGPVNVAVPVGSLMGVAG